MPQGSAPNPTEFAMPTVLIEVSHHHNSDKPTYKALLDIPEGSDPDVHAMLLAINDEYGIDADREAGAVIAAIDEAKKTGEPVNFEIRDFSDYEEGDTTEFTVWYKAPEKPGEKPNFGMGEGDGKNKYENVWLSVKPYEPDPAMRKRLEKLDKEQLLTILLRTHAASYLSFPPSI